MNNKNLLTFFFLLIILSSFVFSQPVGQSVGDINIFYPKQDVFKFDEDVSFNIVSFDSNGSLLNNNDYDCNINIYDINGSNKLNEIMTNDINLIDKTFIFNSSSQINMGWYFYNVWCNSTTETGSISESFELTHTGKSITEIIKYQYLVIFGVIGIIFILLYVSFKLDIKEHWALIIMFVGFSLFLLTNITRSIYNVYPNLPQSIDLVIYILRLIKFIIYYTIIWLLIRLLNHYGKLNFIIRKIKVSFGKRR